MKAIILAAGMGTRLGSLTKEKPKGMLEFMGKTLIEREIEALRAGGISEIIVVRGYMAEKIDYPNVKYYDNKDYAETNMVESLMCAKEELTGDVIVSYADILYEPRVVKALIASEGDVVVTVDTAWRDYWRARVGSDTEDIESLNFDSSGERIEELGSPETNTENIDARYVGLIKFSARGIEIAKEVYEKEKAACTGGKWRNSKSFAKGYMTDLLQAIIDSGREVRPLKIEHGWLEFDNVSDYEKAVEWSKSGTIGRYFNG